jgi:hypothetical protein
VHITSIAGSNSNNGAGDEIRTDGLDLGKVIFSRKQKPKPSAAIWASFALEPSFELTTVHFCDLLEEEVDAPEA